MKIFMRHDKKMENRREQSKSDELLVTSCFELPVTRHSSLATFFVAVDWHDCAWSPQIVVQVSGGASVPASRLVSSLAPPKINRRPATKRLPAPPQILHTPRRNPIYFKTMKTILPSSRRARA
jgi:hypothetical protein